jgi:hypothetical protein
MIADRTQTMTAAIPRAVVLSIMVTGTEQVEYGSIPGDVNLHEAREILALALMDIEQKIALAAALPSQDAPEAAHAADVPAEAPATPETVTAAK